MALVPTSLLISFVSFLSEDEKDRVSRMPLTGKEKLIRDLLLKNESGFATKTELMQELGLTSTHYDKISTLVLKKAYRHLAGPDELEQLNFLSKKFMFRHLFHEIRQLKSKVKEKYPDREQREKYFRSFFDFSINVPAKYFEEKFVLANAQVYLRNVVTDRPSRELEVKAKLMFARLNVLTQRAPNTAAATRIEHEIAALEDKYAHVKSPEAKAILLHVWVNFYRMVQPDWKKRTECLKRIEQLYGGPENMPSFERAMAMLHQAEMKYEQGDYVNAFQCYTQVFAQYMPMLRNQFHHFARWIELAIILGNLDDAKRLLDTLFKVYVVNHHETNGVIGSLLYALLHLSRGELDESFKYVSLAKSLNSIQVYFNYEIKMRMLETLYFAFTGDYDFVSRLSQRNVRYIQLQKLSLKKYKYAHFFYMLKDFNNLRRLYPGRLPQKIKAYLCEFDSGYDKPFGILLYRLLEKTAEGSMY